MTAVAPRPAGTTAACRPPRPLPADALYGRLLASAAQHLLGGGPAPRARVRRADGRLEALPLDRWVGPADATDRAVLARRRRAGARPRLRPRAPPGGAARARQARARRRPLPRRRPAGPRARRGRRSPARCGRTSPAAGGPSCCWTATSASAARPPRCCARAAELLAPGGRVARGDRPARRADAADADPARGAGRGQRVVPLGAGRRRRHPRGGRGRGARGRGRSRSVAGRTFATLRRPLSRRLPPHRGGRRPGRSGPGSGARRCGSRG